MPFPKIDIPKLMFQGCTHFKIVGLVSESYDLYQIVGKKIKIYTMNSIYK